MLVLLQVWARCQFVCYSPWCQQSRRIVQQSAYSVRYTGLQSDLVCSRAELGIYVQVRQFRSSVVQRTRCSAWFIMWCIGYFGAVSGKVPYPCSGSIFHDVDKHGTAHLYTLDLWVLVLCILQLASSHSPLQYLASNCRADSGRLSL